MTFQAEACQSSQTRIFRWGLAEFALHFSRTALEDKEET
jgi:hypothetical protein